MSNFLVMTAPALLVALAGAIAFLIARSRHERTPEEIDHLIAELEREKASHRKA